MTPDRREVEAELDSVEVESAEVHQAPPSDDLPVRGWITIGLFVLLAIVFLVVCLPLLM